MTSFGRFVLVLLAALVALVAIAGCGGSQTGDAQKVDGGRALMAAR